MIWQELTSAAFAKLNRSIPVVLPMAAVEQHGPHLPLSTDRLIGEHFAWELHRDLSDKVLILPMVAVGCSQHHMDFPGTLTLSHDTFAAQVMEILGSAAAHGFKNLVMLNSHGGNLGIGQVILEKLGAQHPDCRIVMVTWWKAAADLLAGLTETGPGGVGHACEFETSLMMLIAPNLVDQSAMEPGRNTATFAWAEGDMLRGASANVYRSMKTMTPNGVYGRPDKASAKKGRAIRDAVMERLKTIIRDLGQAPVR